MSAPEPVIVSAAVVAGHDGQAELAVDIRYPNGALRQTVFPVGALGPVLDAAGVGHLDGLVGAPWSVLLAGRTVTPPATTTAPRLGTSLAAHAAAPTPLATPQEAPACST